MRSIKVFFSDGNSLVTSINGTTVEIINYYLGKWFNVGPVEDKMVQAIVVEFLN